MKMMFYHDITHQGYAIVDLPQDLPNQLLRIFNGLFPNGVDGIGANDGANDVKLLFNQVKAIKNVFGYSNRKNYGKEFWKFRALDISEDLVMDYDELLFNDIVDVIIYLHTICSDALQVIGYALGDGALFKGYEEDFLVATDSPFSLSFINFLNYFNTDDIPKPCRKHCDPCLITIVPLNNDVPSLEIFDVHNQEWVLVEGVSNKPSFTEAVIFPSETLCRISNGQITPLLHRVVKSSVSANRFSCPYQLSAKKLTVIDCENHVDIFGEVTEGYANATTVSEFMQSLPRMQRADEESITQRYLSTK
eukprot:TRINITY_DN6208_c0_g1_i2.p1 TRINITY_DN6208_c0_g1~~TRINITY_DN6208_c0_g1_i2.p1  ORF type:complete len:338 (-),score=62.70 TRINITY_DN6208_c0_g1_i2:246-1163(-)